MAETRSLPVIEEEEVDEDFYENIEAPKFVDFTTPDTRRPDDDRHWFCLRFGCDQKHEEELDSEAIYKDFVLRVMAARSPNVRLRKELNRREASEKLKCPLTAPAKSSKSRVSRMALISSLSKKMTDNNVKVRPLHKVTATPNAKVKQSPSVAKALTTPRNQKKVSNAEPFRTVQSKKATSVVVPKSRVVARSLFNSPKKVKTKSSIELKTPMKALCSGFKKLELNGVKKNGEGCNNSLPVTASRKKLRGREVKSRVFDSLYSNNRKGPETNNVRCLKEKKVNGMQQCQVTMPHEETENDYSDMEIDGRSRGGSLERCTESGTSGGSNELSLGAEKSQEPTRGESSVLVLSEASRGDITSLSSSKEESKTSGSGNEERRNIISEKGEISDATKRKRKGEEHSMASDDKENEEEFTENDDKENASASDVNRVVITNNGDLKKAILGSKHEDSRKTPKKSTSTPAGSQVVKYRKLKPTNPKPFKLRTDERGILREANLDKKIPSPLKETTAKGGKAMRKHENKSESEQDADSYSRCEDRSNQTQGNIYGSIQNDKSNGKEQHKLSATTPYRSAGPKLQKPDDRGNRIELEEKAAKKLDDRFKRKSQMMQLKVVRPRATTPCKLSVIIEKPSNSMKPKEAEKPRKNYDSPTSKATSRTCSRGRRALTVPKEPKFHSLHVPKSCTTRK